MSSSDRIKKKMDEIDSKFIELKNVIESIKDGFIKIEVPYEYQYTSQHSDEVEICQDEKDSEIALDKALQEHYIKSKFGV